MLIKDLDITFCSSVKLLGKVVILKPISAVLLRHFNLKLVLLFILHSTFVFTGLAYVMSKRFSFIFLFGFDIILSKVLLFISSLVWHLKVWIKSTV